MAPSETTVEHRTLRSHRDDLKAGHTGATVTCALGTLQEPAPRGAAGAGPVRGLFRSPATRETAVRDGISQTVCETFILVPSPD